MKKFTKKIAPYLYLLPALILLGLFVYYPFGKTVVGSFFWLTGMEIFQSSPA